MFFLLFSANEASCAYADLEIKAVFAQISKSNVKVEHFF